MDLNENSCKYDKQVGRTTTFCDLLYLSNYDSLVE